MGRKDKRGNAASFLKLDNWVFEHPSYRSLSLEARSLMWELIRVYNGHNNGRLFLSHRLAAERLGRHRNSIGKYYSELERAGFVHKTRGHCLGPEGTGQATHWALTHLGVGGERALMGFKHKTPAQ
jgi:hypothetical protein